MTRLCCVVAVVLVAVSVLPSGAVVASTACAGAEPALASAATALDEGRWDEAERLLQPLEPTHPDCGQVVVAVARLCAARGDLAEAERLFSRAMTLAPDDAIAHARFARFQLLRGLGPQAAHLVTQALTIDPDCVEALVIRGMILAHRGLYGESRRVLERAVVLDPESPEAHYEIGVWFFRVNLFAQAARQFESAVALRPSWTRALDYLAYCFELLGEADRADQFYRAALQTQPNGGPLFDATLDYNFGRFLFKTNRLEESLLHLDRAVEHHPKRRGPRYQRAKVYHAQGDFESARRDAERALALGVTGDYINDVQVYYLLTTIYSRLGETELAERFAELARTTEISDQSEALRRR